MGAVIITAPPTIPGSTEYRQAVCERKRTYLSLQTARNAAWLFKLARGGVTYPYRCEFCRDWHLTSRKPKRRGGSR